MSMRPMLLLVAFVPAVSGCERRPLTSTGVVGVFGSTGMGPGAFSYPRAVCRSPSGKLYIVDKTARVQRFDDEGNFETSWTMPDSAAGKPVGLSVHPDGRIFVADTHYHRVMVFDADGRELSRFGELGSLDGQFHLPTDVAFDVAGHVYVAEYGGNDRITRWSPNLSFDRVFVAGEIDGRPLRRPSAILVDAEQTLWVADACNHRILRFDMDGRLLTQFGRLGDAAGELRYPYDLDIDRSGKLLVCEYGNCRLQWFDAAGRSLGLWGGPGRELGRLNSPWGAVFGDGGRVYALDSLNARVQIIRP